MNPRRDGATPFSIVQRTDTTSASAADPPLRWCAARPARSRSVLTQFLERTPHFSRDPQGKPSRVKSLMVRRFARLPLRMRSG
jgi:hypothetical protein